MKTNDPQCNSGGFRSYVISTKLSALSLLMASIAVIAQEEVIISVALAGLKVLKL